jgi:hypothetical protein
MIHFCYYSMKTYTKYSEEYIKDPDYVKTIDGIGYMVDICEVDEDDNPHNLLRDYITYDFIKQESAIVVNDRVYQINIIYDWIMKHNSRDPIKIPISQDEITRIKNRYLDQKNLKKLSISFHDNIARGDILLLSGDRYLYSYTWYYNTFSYNIVYATNDLHSVAATHCIKPDEYISYIRKTDPDYYAYAAKVTHHL